MPGGSSGNRRSREAAGECLETLGGRTPGQCAPAGRAVRRGRAETNLWPASVAAWLVAFASSLDQIGPLARDVAGTALLLNTIAGYDPRDSTSMGVSVPDYRAALTGDVRAACRRYNAVLHRRHATAGRTGGAVRCRDRHALSRRWAPRGR